MEYIHVRNLGKFHPGYKDRKLSFAKIFCDMVKGDPDCEMIEDEVDWGRLIRIILLELRAQKPLPNTDRYWKQNGFNVKKRSMSLTLQVLHNFIDIVPEELKQACLREEEEEEEEEEKEEEGKTVTDRYSSFETTTVTLWNDFCKKHPNLKKINHISGTRRTHLRKRFTNPGFKDFVEILRAVEEQPFLLDGNPNSKDHKNWRINFDWIIANDTNYVKVLERRYKNDDTSSRLFR